MFEPGSGADYELRLIGTNNPQDVGTYKATLVVSLADYSAVEPLELTFDVVFEARATNGLPRFDRQIPGFLMVKMT